MSASVVVGFLYFMELQAALAATTTSFLSPTFVCLLRRILSSRWRLDQSLHCEAVSVAGTQVSLSRACVFAVSPHRHARSSYFDDESPLAGAAPNWVAAWSGVPIRLDSPKPAGRIAPAKPFLATDEFRAQPSPRGHGYPSGAASRRSRKRRDWNAELPLLGWQTPSLPPIAQASRQTSASAAQLQQLWPMRRPRP